MRRLIDDLLDGVARVLVGVGYPLCELYGVGSTHGFLETRSSSKPPTLQIRQSGVYPTALLAGARCDAHGGLLPQKPTYGRLGPSLRAEENDGHPPWPAEWGRRPEPGASERRT